MDRDCHGGETAPVNKREMGRELKEKVSREVLLDQIAALSCLIGEEFECVRVRLFVCIRHTSSAWHFIFELPSGGTRCRGPPRLTEKASTRFLSISISIFGCK